MIRIAMMRDGNVENVIVWDGVDHWQPPEDISTITLEEDSPVGPGWVYDKGTWVPPPPPED